MIVWRLKTAYLPTRLDNGARVWFEQYWEGVRTYKIVKRKGSYCKEDVVTRVAAWVYEEQSRGVYRKVFVDNPDRCHWLHDAAIDSLNRKDW